MDRLDKIGLLGGSFDPIHLGHINMGLRALEDFGLDKVFYITAKNSPFKINKSFLDSSKRHELVEQALQDYPKLEASRIELDREEEVSYSHKTIEEYKKLYPDSELFLLMGEDVFSCFNEWKNSDWIKKNVQFIVFHREEAGELNLCTDNISLNYVEDFDFPISSSILRTACQKKQALS